MNRTSLSSRATWRTRSRSLDTPIPALRPGRVSLAAFPLAGPLPSTTSAPAITAGLFGSFVGTTGPSDFPRPFIEGLPPKRSPHDPPCRSTTPRTIQDGASVDTAGDRGTSRFSRMEISVRAQVL